HVELLTDKLEQGGLPRAEARRRAILRMGGLNPTRDVQRQSRGLPWFECVLEGMQGVARDLGHAARSLARARTFTLVCLLSLGLGMGTFVALVTLFRGITSPARGIEIAGLVELLVRPQGPLRERAGVEALDEWSYPDFDVLRQTESGMTLTGWA